MTDITRLRMMSSEVSTSSRPPTTTGRRDGFTCRRRGRGPYPHTSIAHTHAHEHAHTFTHTNRYTTRPLHMRTQRGLTHLLYIDLDVLGQLVLLQVQHKVMDKVKTIADDDQWQLVGEFRLLHTKSVTASQHEWEQGTHTHTHTSQAEVEPLPP